MTIQEAVISKAGELVPVPPVTSDQLELIRKTIAKDATPDELLLYLHDCRRQGVHPLDKLLYFTKRKGKYTPVTSIDLMRMRAADTGEYCGNDQYTFTGTPGQRGFVAVAQVWRAVNGQRVPFARSARWEEYCPEAGSDFMWRKMPHVMLGKCAEAQALRAGFPRQLHGLYAEEEIQTDHTRENPPVVADIPGATAGIAKFIDANARETGPAHQTSIPSVPLTPPPDVELPAGALLVREVVGTPTKNPAVTRYSVTFSTGEVCTTINGWLASRAKEFGEAGTPVKITTKETKFGTDVTAINPADEPPMEPLPLDEIPF